MRGVAGLTAVLTAVLLMWAPAAMAQQAPAPAPAQPAPAPAERQIEGKIQTVDATGKSITLADGTKLMIPDTLSKTVSKDLKPGATVKASYKVDAGQNMVTKLEVTQ